MRPRKSADLIVTLGVAGQLGDVKNIELVNIDAVDLPLKVGDEITFRVSALTREVVER